MTGSAREIKMCSQLTESQCRRVGTAHHFRVPREPPIDEIPDSYRLPTRSFPASLRASISVIITNRIKVRAGGGVICTHSGSCRLEI